MSKKEETELGEDFSYILRIADTDMDGLKPLRIALTSVKGIGSRTAEMICNNAGFDAFGLAGNLSVDEQEVLKTTIETYAENPEVPVWMLNRQRDLESGDELHLVGMDLKMVTGDDIDRLRATKAYRGIRHASGKKVRGQRGRSNGRTGLTLGVTLKK
ncbi:MAG: 30S ribosomal protein S13 [Euryarchaeota archaeon]|jgi:small subunit ribosomal protein S13|nr:30S ribosomal protein S13 [Euryarchaeota archaeon]MBT3971692.1 30S ribosomal protein S13 [Euryarchaeota archaeon]MBT4406339.1 30S ribosomal protein S13 [Euryarchaeota archaeon]